MLVRWECGIQPVSGCSEPHRVLNINLWWECNPPLWKTCVSPWEQHKASQEFLSFLGWYLIWLSFTPSSAKSGAKLKWVIYLPAVLSLFCLAPRGQKRCRPSPKPLTEIFSFVKEWWHKSVAFNWVINSCLLPQRVCLRVCVCGCVCSTVPKVLVKHSNTLVSGNLVFHSVISLSCHVFQITLPTVRKPPSQWLQHIFNTSSTFAGPTSHPPHTDTLEHDSSQA